MGKLIDIEVDRVDGVDTPATRRAFILRKSAVVDDPVKEDEASTEDEAAFHENVRALANSASAVLKALHDSGDEIPLSEDMASLLNTMSKSLGVEFDFKATQPKAKTPPPDDSEEEPDPADPNEGDEPDETDPEEDPNNPAVKKPPKPAMKDVEEPLSAEAIGASVAEALAPMLQSLAKSQRTMTKQLKELAAAEPVATITKSQQVRRQPTSKAAQPTDMGDGVFTSVIFGSDR